MEKQFERAILTLAQIDEGKRAAVIFGMRLEEIISQNDYEAFDDAKKLFMTNYIANKLAQKDGDITPSRLAEAESMALRFANEPVPQSPAINQGQDKLGSSAHNAFAQMLERMKLNYLRRPALYSYTFTSPELTEEMIEIVECECLEEQTESYSNFVLRRLERIWLLTENVADSREDEERFPREEVGTKCKELCEIVHEVLVQSRQRLPQV